MKQDFVLFQHTESHKKTNLPTYTTQNLLQQSISLIIVRIGSIIKTMSPVMKRKKPASAPKSKISKNDAHESRTQLHTSTTLQHLTSHRPPTGRKEQRQRYTEALTWQRVVLAAK